MLSERERTRLGIERIARHEDIVTLLVRADGRLPVARRQELFEAVRSGTDETICGYVFEHLEDPGLGLCVFLLSGAGPDD